MNIYYDIEDNCYRTYPDGDIATTNQMTELIENKNLSIAKLQQENKKLNGAIQTYDILLKSNVEENKQLKKELKSKPDTEITLQDNKGNEFVLIQTERIDMQEKLNKTNERLFNNWNKLKEWAKNNIKYWEEQEKKWIELGIVKVGGEANNKIMFKMILDIMQELEQGSDSNE